jgi:hypothetical protein
VLGELRFDVIQPNGTNDKNGHRRETMRFAGRAFQQKNTRRGASQVKGLIPKAACFWILVEGHSASRLCAAVCSFGSDGQGARK